jgi:hypothetical protein
LPSCLKGRKDRSGSEVEVMRPNMRVTREREDGSLIFSIPGSLWMPCGWWRRSSQTVFQTTLLDTVTILTHTNLHLIVLKVILSNSSTRNLYAKV